MCVVCTCVRGCASCVCVCVCVCVCLPANSAMHTTLENKAKQSSRAPLVHIPSINNKLYIAWHTLLVHTPSINNKLFIINYILLDTHCWCALLVPISSAFRTCSTASTCCQTWKLTAPFRCECHLHFLALLQANVLNDGVDLWDLGLLQQDTEGAPVHLWFKIIVHLIPWVCICAWRISVCVCVCVCVWVCVCVHVCVFVCACVFVHVCMYKWVLVCVGVCVGVYVFVCVIWVCALSDTTSYAMSETVCKPSTNIYNWRVAHNTNQFNSMRL